MKIKSIETQKLYKLEKEKEKIKKQMQKKIEKRKVYLEQLKQRQLEKIRGAMNTKYKKKLSKFEKKVTVESQKKIKNIDREIKGHKKVEYKKKPKTRRYWFIKATTEFQKWIRLSKSNINGYAIMMDTKERRNIKGCDAGHLFGKHNYPHLVFEPDNVRPITKRGNKTQGDQIGQWWENVKLEIGDERFDVLVAKSKDKKAKENAKNWTKEYFEEIYKIYKKKNEILQSSKMKGGVFI